MTSYIWTKNTYSLLSPDIIMVQTFLALLSACKFLCDEKIFLVVVDTHREKGDCTHIHTRVACAQRESKRRRQ